jgi:hypothetical protein
VAKGRGDADQLSCNDTLRHCRGAGTRWPGNNLDKQMIFSMKGNDGVLVLWKDTALVIEHSKRDRIYRKAVVWHGQPITYIEREP